MSIWQGNKLKLSVFGASHAPSIGFSLSGIPKGAKVDEQEISSLLDRRRAVSSAYSTQRKEADVPVFTAGVDGGVVIGEEITAIIENTSVISKDYEKNKNLMRPSHADYSALMKFGENYDYRGGGQFSGRMTAPICVAGGIAKGILKEKGISVCAYVSSVGKFNFGSYTDGSFVLPTDGDAFGALTASQKTALDDYFISLKKEGDSVGGAIECVVTGAPAGLGDAMFGGLESKISALVFAIPAVKSVEFGLGKEISTLLGSESNDEFYYDGENVKTRTNNNGGINGGISNGMPITLRVAIKPTPSISKPQKTVDIANKKDAIISIEGRHDVCIAPRAVPAIESVVAIALLDTILDA